MQWVAARQGDPEVVEACGRKLDDLVDDRCMPLKKRKAIRLATAAEDNQVPHMSSPDSPSIVVAALEPKAAKSIKRGADRLFSCSTCDYSTNHNWILKRHQLTHSGEKPYRCDICGKSFRQTAHVAGHMRVHSGEKSWYCDLCGDTFKRSDTLAKHKLTHLKVRSAPVNKTTVTPPLALCS